MAYMATREYLFAWERDHGNTFCLTTAFFESWLWRLINSLDLFGAKSAFTSVLITLCLVTGHTNVVWLASAWSTEVFRAIWASYSAHGHMLSCLRGNNCACIVLLLVVGLWGFEHNYARALTADHLRVKFNPCVHLLGLNLAHFFRRQNLSNFFEGHCFVAAAAKCIFKVDIVFPFFHHDKSLLCAFLKARDVEPVVALRR